MSILIPSGFSETRRYLFLMIAAAFTNFLLTHTELKRIFFPFHLMCKLSFYTWAANLVGAVEKVKYFWPQQVVCREWGGRPPVLEAERGLGALWSWVTLLPSGWRGASDLHGALAYRPDLPRA